MPEETSPRLLLEAQEQRLGAEQDPLPCGPIQEPVQATVKRQKLAWFRHVTRHNSLSKTILQGTLEGGRRAVVGRGNAGWTTSEWISADDGLSAAEKKKKKTKTKQTKNERRSLLNRVSPD